MTEQQNTRKFEPTVGDYVAFILGRHDVSIEGVVEESVIADFCKGCDKLQEDGVCKLVGSNYQARYAGRQWCGWVSVNGVRGQMTSEGFKGGEGSSK